MEIGNLKKKQMTIHVGGYNQYRFGGYLFPLFNFISFVSAFVIDIRAGFVAGMIIFAFAIIHPECFKCFHNSAFTVFFLANILSVYAYAFNERPIEIFLSCFTYNLIPMLMYGIGMCSKMDEEHNPVFKGIVISNSLIVVVGFAIYFSPSIAARLGMYSITTAGIDANGVGYRFGSYFDSLMLGSICAISIPLLLTYDFKHPAIRILMMILFSVALFLTMQRGAWLVGIISMVGCMIISLILKKKGIKVIFFYLLGGIAIIYAVIYFVNNFMSEGFLEHLQIRLRSLNMNTMLGRRSHQVNNGLDIFLQYPLGFGLGAAGNKASPYNMQIVPDGNYIRILVETGFVGFASFVILNIKSLISGIKKKKYYSVLILMLFLAHAIGSNVFDFYYGSFVYWFILGYLASSPTENGR